MKMLKHIPTGRVYVFSEPLSRADDMEEFDDPDFGTHAEQAKPATEQEPEQAEPSPVRSLDEMTREELLRIAEQEAEIRGESAALSRMKKADIIAYIAGEGA